MDSDSSEVLLNIFAHELGKQREIYPKPEHIFKAVSKTHRRCDGAYAVIAVITGSVSLLLEIIMGFDHYLLALEKGKQDEYIVASEDAMFSSQGFKKLRDVEPGEAIFIDKNGKFTSQQCDDLN